MGPKTHLLCRLQRHKLLKINVTTKANLPFRGALKKQIPISSCTETLEHVPDADAVIAQILRYCKPGTKLLISVPIEIGPSLLFKQMGRFLANRTGRYGYEPYQWNELFRAAVLRDNQSFPSSHTRQDGYRGHKGFDYRKIEEILKGLVTVEKRLYSPLKGLGSFANSTVF